MTNEGVITVDHSQLKQALNMSDVEGWKMIKRFRKLYNNFILNC